MNHITTAVKEIKEEFKENFYKNELLLSLEVFFQGDNFLSSATIKILESVVEESNTPISKIIDWWENKLTPDDRSQMMKESWKGDVNNRHAELRIMYLSYVILSTIDSIKKEQV